MPFKEDQIGNQCPYCSDGTLIRYKSGKIGCDKYCWKNQPQALKKVEKQEYKPFSPSPSQTQTQQGQIVFIEKFDEILGGLDEFNERLDRIEAYLAKIYAKKES